MNNKFDHLFDPDWSEIKINRMYFHELDKVRNNPDDIEELRQAFLNATSEHLRRLRKIEQEKNVMILE